MRLTRSLKQYGFITGAIALLAVSCAKEHAPTADPLLGKTDTLPYFLNPIKEGINNAFATRINGQYYFTSSGGNEVRLTSLKEVQYLPFGYAKTIYSSDPESDLASSSANINAPEIYRFDGKWYTYFGADRDGTNGQRRIYVIENSSEDPLQGEWVMKGKLADPVKDFFASDASILEYNNQRYLIWSGWPKAEPFANTVLQNIYIAKMLNPWTLDGTRKLIAEPANLWERYQYVSAGRTITEGVNQNPQAIVNAEGQAFITFTANTCLSPNASVGLLTLKPGGDPMIMADWTKSPSPIFVSNDFDAYGPGFNSFFKSPDGTEDWMAYDAGISSGGSCGSARSMRIQKISWNSDGSPNLGTPAMLTDTIIRPARN